MSQVQSRPALPSLLERSSYSYSSQSDQYKPREAGRAYDPISHRSDDSWDSYKSRSPVTEYRKDYHDRSSTGQSSSDMNQRAPREQLPSLSSLFGSAPLPPTQAPYTRSPPFPALSPPQERRDITPSRQEFKSSGSPTFFRPATASNPQEYASRRSDFTERIALPPPSRSSSRPDSPRTHEARYSPYETSRPQLPGPTTSRWSPISEPSTRQDYFHLPRDTTSFRGQLDGQRSEIDGKVGYRENHPSSPQYANAPGPAPGSDPIVTKDSLGPKIWTGTHFLPRFVREAEVPGEGLCYFYDDGSHCKTVIDGEAVNAHWGVTKAGKPRKRLAIACITCREKKIKCDPDYPRCIQCEKFGRTCRFKNAPRGGRSPETSSVDLDDELQSSSQQFELECQDAEKTSQYPHSSPRSSNRQLTPDREMSSAKKRRTSYGVVPTAGERWADPTGHTAVSSPRSSAGTSQLTEIEHPQGLSATPDALLRELQSNPAEANPDLVADLIATYFTHMGSASYCMFAVKPFNEWLFNTRMRKSLDDLMLIYSILALASTFSTSSSLKMQGKRFAAISRYACEHRPFTLQLVQSRLLLSLYSFASSNPRDSWDLVGGAIRAASKLKLNVELEQTEDAHLKVFPLGLNKAGYAECRRRTYWCCFLIDRFNGFNNGCTSVTNAEDVFLRLPCSNAAFEIQSEVVTPFFDPKNTPRITTQDENNEPYVGAMGYLVCLTTIFSDVMAYTYRRANRPGTIDHDPGFEGFYRSASKRLDGWQRNLPKYLQYSLTNLHRTASATVVGPYTSMHVLYFLTQMKLNRYIRLDALTETQQRHHLLQAHNAAQGLLAIVNDLAALSSFQNKGRNEFSTPLVGFASVCALDILTSKVQFDARMLAELRDRFAGLKQVIDELAMYWQSARIQRLIIAKRLDEVERLGLEMKSDDIVDVMGARFVALREPLEKAYPQEDGVYKAGVHIWVSTIMGL